MVPTCSSDTLTNVLPHRNAMPLTHRVTVYRHRTALFYMAVGTGGQGGELPPPPIFCQPKKFKIAKTTTYRLMYRNMD